MALVKRVFVNKQRDCTKCKKPIGIGVVAIKDRRSKYKISGTQKEKNKKIIRMPNEPTKYYHIECYK